MCVTAMMTSAELFAAFCCHSKRQITHSLGKLRKKNTAKAMDSLAKSNETGDTAAAIAAACGEGFM